MYDPFETQKQDAYFKAMGSIEHLSEHIVNLISTKNDSSAIEQQHNLIDLIKLDLWGNR